MTTTTRDVPTTMLPYRKQGEIDYASLDFDPFELEPLPEGMEQNPIIKEILDLMEARFTDLGRRPDTFLDTNTDLCYDRGNLNVRVKPDVYLAFGVDQLAIRKRALYLPWEAGKVPDWVLEVGSKSTGSIDVARKPLIYARIGVIEYWRFDPSGGEHHGGPLYGGRLAEGVYQPVPLTTEPDGILKGYSEVLKLSLCWDEGWPLLYDPATGSYLENRRQEKDAREEAEARAAFAEARIAEEQSARRAAEARISELEELIHRLAP